MGFVRIFQNRKQYKLKISIRYLMRKVEIIKQTRLTIAGIEGFMVREVTPFGTSAKVSCPKEYLGRKVYLVFTK